MELYDLTIVGAGPVGLYGATLASLHGMSVKVVESLPECGGQLRALYPEKLIYDVPGFPAVTGKALAAALEEQALQYQPRMCLGETVEELEIRPDGTFVLRSAKATHFTRAILITAGIGAFAPRKLPAEGAQRFEGRGVYYFVPAFQSFQGMRVVVVGGGDTALDWTLALAPYAAQVILVHRRTEFRAQAESVRRVRELGNVVVRTPCEVREVGGTDTVEWVTLTCAGTGQEERLPADAVVSGLGFHSDLGPIRHWGLEVVGSTVKVDPATMQTSLPGIFAAGDVVSYPGKVRLIANGFGEIGIAVDAIRHYLHPSVTGHLPHSTNLKHLQTMRRREENP